MTGDRIEIRIYKGTEEIVMSDKLPDVAYSTKGLLSSMAWLEPSVVDLLWSVAHALTDKTTMGRLIAGRNSIPFTTCENLKSRVDMLEKALRSISIFSRLGTLEQYDAVDLCGKIRKKCDEALRED